jgi:hypothetical protein
LRLRSNGYTERQNNFQKFGRFDACHACAKRLARSLCVFRNLKRFHQEDDLDSKQRVEVRSGKAVRTVVLGLLVALVAVAITGIASAQENTDLKFRGGIGVIPVTGVSATGTVNLNVVRGVNPAGPWRIADLDATVTSDGHIRVKGRGLLLAAGNGIGTNAGASVFASLFCGAAASATEHDTNRVALDADGDFRINALLSPALTGTCDTPVLLIRNGGASPVWFAAGIPEAR